MRFAVAILLAVALLATPLACVAAGCDLTKPSHECCPRSRALTTCPYDVLAAAKASQPQLPLWLHAAFSGTATVGLATQQFAPKVVVRSADGRDLHTRICLLLI